MADISNNLGKHLKMDLEKAQTSLTMYASICVEVDLDKGLPEKMNLKWNNYKWVQLLDYENTTFQCKICQQTRHLHGSCPLACVSNSRTK